MRRRLLLTLFVAAALAVAAVSGGELRSDLAKGDFEITGMNRAIWTSTAT